MGWPSSATSRSPQTPSRRGSQPGRQPHATVDEWHDCDAAMRAHPEVRAALAGRGITDPELVLIDVWTYGAHSSPSGTPDGASAGATSGYGKPPVATRMRTRCRAEADRRPQHDGAPFDRRRRRRRPSARARRVRPSRPARAPAAHRSEAPAGHAARGGVVHARGPRASWQRWRDAARLHLPRGFGAAHRLLRRAAGGLPDRVRGDGGALPRPDARSLPAHRIRRRRMGPRVHDDLAHGGLRLPRRDPLPRRRVARLFGRTEVVRNAICVHEEDDGVLWKHVDGHTGAQVRRRRGSWCRSTSPWRTTSTSSTGASRRRQIDCEVRATGIMVTTPSARADRPPYGTVVDKSTYAPHPPALHRGPAGHGGGRPGQHRRMVETAQPPIGPDNPHGLALHPRTVPLRTEAEGRQDIMGDPARVEGDEPDGRATRFGAPVAYTLVPGGAIPPMLDPRRRCSSRARCLATPCGSRRSTPTSAGHADVHEPEQRVTSGCPCGRRPTGRSRTPTSCSGTSSGSTTSPRVEDWPVMPVDIVAFRLKPSGFFDREPGARRGSMTRYGGQYGPDITFLGVDAATSRTPPPTTTPTS